MAAGKAGGVESSRGREEEDKEEEGEANAAGDLPSGTGPQVKAASTLYHRRWLMLALFILYSATNSFQWLQYSIITDSVTLFYGVSTLAVDWTSIIYMVTYIPLVFLSSWILDKKNLRISILIGAFGTALGAWIKCISASPNLFAVSFVGQTVVAVSQIFILSVPPKLSSVWFGSREVSTACALGVLGNQVGIALGFLLPPLLVPDEPSVEKIGQGLLILYLAVAAVCTVSFLLILTVFQDHPPSPPSLSQAFRESTHGEEEAAFCASMHRFATNRSFMVLLVTYGLNVGVFYAVSTFLGQLINENFQHSSADAGRMGLCMVVSGVVGSILGGVILDKTHWYNFFMTGYLPIGFEFALELTFPDAEGTSSGLLNCSAQIFGIVLVNACSFLKSAFGGFWCNIMLTSCLSIGLLLSFTIDNDLRRLFFQKSNHKTVKA